MKKKNNFFEKNQKKFFFVFSFFFRVTERRVCVRTDETSSRMKMKHLRVYVSRRVGVRGNNAFHKAVPIDSARPSPDLSQHMVVVLPSWFSPVRPTDLDILE